MSRFALNYEALTGQSRSRNGGVTRHTRRRKEESGLVNSRIWPTLLGVTSTKQQATSIAQVEYGTEYSGQTNFSDNIAPTPATCCRYMQYRIWDVKAAWG